MFTAGFIASSYRIKKIVIILSIYLGSGGGGCEVHNDITG